MDEYGNKSAVWFRKLGIHSFRDPSTVSPWFYFNEVCLENSVISSALMDDEQAFLKVIKC
jgi:hypothetical protein